MQTLGGLLVTSVLAFYHRFFRLSLRFFILIFMDFPSTFRFIAKFSELGCGLLLLGYVSPLFNFLGLLLIFLFCLRLLRLSPNTKHNDNDNNSNSRPYNSEDHVFDVMSLRRMVKAERQRYQAACAEIEQERGAAASAAEEAMAMILRLQSEKSAVEIQAKQFRRVVEQRQEYDHEVMESLRWTAEQEESQKNLLERQLEALRERLGQFLNEHEIEHLRDEEDEEGTATGTATGSASVVGDYDDDSSGFLNFSVELDVEVSPQIQSPTYTHTEQDHL
uniref:GTD-binding domain-containing protein n=1 Tax=Cajanus cajan TaxID=3821 RepID=A0A151T7Q6_CAJCA|nr:hypothetical protein KK1_017655 [Cajanus cajan]